MHLFVKRSKRVCIIVTRRPLGQSPRHGNLELLKCRLALQKCRLALQMCRIGPMAPNALSCLGAVWTPLLGFFGWSLYLDMFSSFVYDFSFLFFFGLFRLFKNNYLVDKYPKINLGKVQIIHNFIVIQSSLLFPCMYPYFKY